MEFEGLRKRQTTPDLTPLIDVVFLLLVFFMLTAHFIENESITLTLPAASSSAPLPEDKPALELLVDVEQRLFLQGEAIDKVLLPRALQALLSSREDKALTLKAEQGVEFGLAVELLDIARVAGADDVNIVTRRP